MDLGSGGGALVRAAIRQGGFGRATGYEINPALVGLSWLRAAPGETHRLQSLWDADLSDADVCIVYGVPSMLGELGVKLREELPSGSYVVSNLFRIPEPPLRDCDGAEDGRPAGEEPRQERQQRQQLKQVDSQWIDVGGVGGMSLDDAGRLYLYRAVPAVGEAVPACRRK